MSTTQSGILPAATGKIYHARIVKTERSIQQAQYLFEVFKERVA
jgi:hypothetical protein